MVLCASRSLELSDVSMTFMDSNHAGDRRKLSQSGTSNKSIKDAQCVCPICGFNKGKHCLAKDALP